MWSTTASAAFRYLRHLASLHISNCREWCDVVPSNLTEATQLTHLTMTIALTPVDMVMLSALPALRKLSIRTPEGLDQEDWDDCDGQLEGLIPGVYIKYEP